LSNFGFWCPYFVSGGGIFLFHSNGHQFCVSGLSRSYMETFDADMNSEISLPSQLSSHTSDGSIFMSTSESSYNSDQGSGNEDGQDATT